MIYRLALIAVLALSQLLVAASYQSKAPEHNRPSADKATVHSADLNQPSENRIEAIDSPLQSQNRKAGTSDSNEKSQRADPKGGSGKGDPWFRQIPPVVYFIAAVAGIMGTALALILFPGSRKANKATVESAQIGKQTLLSALARMTFDHTEEECENNHRVRFMVVWNNTGHTHAFLVGICAAPKISDLRDPVPISDSALVQLHDQKLAPEDKIPCSTDFIPFSGIRQASKAGSVFYLCSRLEYKDISDTTTKTEYLTFKVTLRSNLLSPESPTHRYTGKGVPRFDVSLISSQSLPAPKPH
jgi:hypothetical protein